MRKCMEKIILIFECNIKTHIFWLRGMDTCSRFCRPPTPRALGQDQRLTPFVPTSLIHLGRVKWKTKSEPIQYRCCVIWTLLFMFTNELLKFEVIYMPSVSMRMQKWCSGESISKGNTGFLIKNWFAHAWPLFTHCICWWMLFNVNGKQGEMFRNQNFTNLKYKCKKVLACTIIGQR